MKIWNPIECQPFLSLPFGFAATTGKCVSWEYGRALAFSVYHEGGQKTQCIYLSASMHEMPKVGDLLELSNLYVVALKNINNDDVIWRVLDYPVKAHPIDVYRRLNKIKRILAQKTRSKNLFNYLTLY